MIVAYIDPNNLPSEILWEKLRKDPAYNELGIVTKYCTPGGYSVDGMASPTICVPQPKQPITTPAGSSEERLKNAYEQLKHGGPDPRTVIPDVSNIGLYDGKALKNGDTLKVINGQLFIRTKAGGQVAVRDQILELQNGAKISVRGGKSIQEVRPGMNMNR